jgi:hypothetical protein
MSDTNFNSAHYDLLNEIETIKMKVTDMEYKTILDKLCKLRQVEKIMSNKAIILDIQRDILSGFLSQSNGDNGINLAQIRPLEAVNFITEFANIIFNIEDMTKETDDEVKKMAKEFIFAQLGTSYTGDYHRTILQMITYERLKGIMNHIEKLDV